ncbi:MAG: bacteriohemerythrin [Treponema sp.]|jgi:hemerythrin|nr:bacteriohemerythrin [Treponema sp.]
MPDAQIEWREDFSVGNDQIDDQHKELIRITGEFISHCQIGGVVAKVAFLTTIQKAVHYVKTHFAAEEAVMKKAGYPEFEIHKRQHEEFVNEVVRQAKMFEREDNPNPGEFSRYLMNWIVEHIADSDKKYIPYIARLDSAR